MRHLALAAAAAAAALVTAGCGIEAGTVIDKNHHESYYYTTTWCHPVGKTTICTPQTRRRPECWQLTLRSDQEPDTTGKRCVSSDEYASIKVGDHWQEADR